MLKEVNTFTLAICIFVGAWQVFFRVPLSLEHVPKPKCPKYANFIKPACGAQRRERLD